MPNLILVDCGRASQLTCGATNGFFREGAPPPFNFYV